MGKKTLTDHPHTEGPILKIFWPLSHLDHLNPPNRGRRVCREANRARRTGLGRWPLSGGEVRCAVGTGDAGVTARSGQGLRGGTAVSPGAPRAQASPCEAVGSLAAGGRPAPPGPEGAWVVDAAGRTPVGGRDLRVRGGCARGGGGRKDSGRSRAMHARRAAPNGPRRPNRWGFAGAEAALPGARESRSRDNGSPVRGSALVGGHGQLGSRG